MRVTATALSIIAALVVLGGCDDSVSGPVPGGSQGAFGGNDNASDHGDTRSRAFKLSRCPARGYNWSIDAFLTSGDFDFFEVECEGARGTLRAYTTGTTGTVGLLVPAYGDGSDNLAGPGENEHNYWDGDYRNYAFWNGAIGKYYIRVRGYLNDTGPYVLKVEWSPYDAPDSWSRAENLSDLRNETTVSRPRYLGELDQDWFQFRISGELGCSTVDIKSTIESRLRSEFTSNPQMHLYSGSSGSRRGSSIAYDDDSGGNNQFNVRVVLRNRRTYYIKVTPYGNRDSSTGSYTLEVIYRGGEVSCIGAIG